MLVPALPKDGPERVLCCILYQRYLDDGDSFEDAKRREIKVARMGRWFVEAGLHTWEELLGVKWT